MSITSVKTMVTVMGELPKSINKLSVSLLCMLDFVITVKYTYNCSNNESQ